jgi:TetR/AcrR family transcriptional regulator, regulator of cefoperazone and chloramphenicol sensitivity
MLPDDTRMRLLDAARDVFAESGYYDATVRDICTRAGVNVAAINYHFGDKLELYTEVLRQSFPPLEREAIRGLLDQDGPPEQALKQVIRFMVRNACGVRNSGVQLRLVARELAQPTPALSRILEEVTRPLYDRLRTLVGKIIGLDRDDVTTRLCTHSIIGQVVHYAHEAPMLAQLWPELKMTPEQVERISDHISDFSLVYLRKARAGGKGSSPESRLRKRK